MAIFRAHTENGSFFLFHAPARDYRGRFNYIETPFGIEKLTLSIRQIKTMERDNGIITHMDYPRYLPNGPVWQSVTLYARHGKACWQII